MRSAREGEKAIREEGKARSDNTSINAFLGASKGNRNETKGQIHRQVHHEIRLSGVKNHRVPNVQRKELRDTRAVYGSIFTARSLHRGPPSSYILSLCLGLKGFAVVSYQTAMVAARFCLVMAEAQR